MRPDPARPPQSATVRPPRGHVLVTADDLGASPEVNAAVARAHRDGILTGASLLVMGDALDGAVSLARATPGLAVGLHLALADSRPVLPPRELPHLAGADGRLLRDPARVFLLLAASAAARREAAREIAAQFDRFAATGLPLSHVDGHHHLHLHPAVFPIVAERAARAGACGIRLPWEGLAALPGARPRSGAVDAVVLGALARGWRGAARRLGLRFTDRVHGIVRSGAMDAAYLLALVAHLDGGAAELFLHPSTARGDARGPNPGDLAALLDPRVRVALDARGLARATYATLERP